MAALKTKKLKENKEATTLLNTLINAQTSVYHQANCIRIGKRSSRYRRYDMLKFMMMNVHL